MNAVVNERLKVVKFRASRLRLTNWHSPDHCLTLVKHLEEIIPIFSMFAAIYPTSLKPVLSVAKGLLPTELFFQKNVTRVLGLEDKRTCRKRCSCRKADKGKHFHRSNDATPRLFSCSPVGESVFWWYVGWQNLRNALRDRLGRFFLQRRSFLSQKSV